MTNRQSVEVLIEADRIERQLDWILFKNEQERLLEYREGEWNVGDLLPGRKLVGRPLVQDIDIFTSSADHNFVIYERCWECEVDWVGDSPCWMCGVRRPNIGVFRYPDRKRSRFQHVPSALEQEMINALNHDLALTLEIPLELIESDFDPYPGSPTPTLFRAHNQEVIYASIIPETFEWGSIIAGWSTDFVAYSEADVELSRDLWERANPPTNVAYSAFRRIAEDFETVGYIADSGFETIYYDEWASSIVAQFGPSSVEEEIAAEIRRRYGRWQTSESARILSYASVPLPDPPYSDIEEVLAEPWRGLIEVDPVPPWIRDGRRRR